MKKEYVITEISASPDGAPYIFITMKTPGDISGPQRKDRTTSGVHFSSMDDMFKNLGHIISKQITGGFSTVIKVSLDEYEKLNIKVGDRIFLEITKMQVGIP